MGFRKHSLIDQMNMLDWNSHDYLLFKGRSRLMDITKLILADKIHPVYSFLTVTWGLIADVDLESEKIR